MDAHSLSSAPTGEPGDRSVLLVEASPKQNSAERKFARGVEQARTLLTEVSSYETRSAIAFSSKLERPGPNEILLRSFATEREAQPEHWPLLAGEAVQSLRAALDHSVYAASGGEERTQFPIYKSAEDFAARPSSWLKGVPEATVAAIERLQPYRLAPQKPTAEPLYLLRELSNADKHRVLATVTTAVQHEAIGIGEGIEGHFEEVATGRPLGPGRRQISLYRATRESTISADELEPMFAYEVLLEGMRFSILKGIVARVFQILAEVETGEPPSPFAHYPL
jgi:hypothetical protein